MKFRGFTITSYENESIKQLSELCGEFVYFVGGNEKCPDTGRDHIQAFVYFKNRRSFDSVRKNLSPRHIEGAKGSPGQNRSYCIKDGDFEEFGELPVQGKRKDLDEIRQEIEAGAKEKDIAERYFSQWCQYGKRFKMFESLISKPRDFKSTVHVFWGKTGTGKTRRVIQFCKPEELFIHGGDRWFDGYTGQLAALFDDFDGRQIDFRFLLRLLDRYPMQVPVKGSFVNWCPRQIYITSNLEPKDWYPTEDFSPLLRRLDCIEKCTDYPASMTS